MAAARAAEVANQVAAVGVGGALRAVGAAGAVAAEAVREAGAEAKAEGGATERGSVEAVEAMVVGRGSAAAMVDPGVRNRGRLGTSASGTFGSSRPDPSGTTAYIRAAEVAAAVRRRPFDGPTLRCSGCRPHSPLPRTTGSGSRPCDPQRGGRGRWGRCRSLPRLRHRASDPLARCRNPQVREVVVRNAPRERPIGLVLGCISPPSHRSN